MPLTGRWLRGKIEPIPDPYLYKDVPVLRNKLNIKDEDTLDLVEAERSRANMMILYEQGFRDFSPAGLCYIHRFLFGDIYDWAGEYRKINIEETEAIPSEDTAALEIPAHEKYRKYQKEPYHPSPHKLKLDH